MLDLRITTKRLSTRGQTRTQHDPTVIRSRARVVVKPVAERPPKCCRMWS
jgi:hypothetical protein